MKRFCAFLALIVVVFASQSVFGQNVRLDVKANSALVKDAVTLDQTKRMSFLVYDEMPLESGYAYEFGAIELVKPDGSRIILQTARMENGPILHYSVRSKLIGLSPEGFVLEIGPIKRYNPNNTSEILPFSKADRSISFLPVAKASE